MAGVPYSTGAGGGSTPGNDGSSARAGMTGVPSSTGAGDGRTPGDDVHCTGEQGIEENVNPAPDMNNEYVYETTLDDGFLKLNMVVFDVRAESPELKELCSLDIGDDVWCCDWNPKAPMISNKINKLILASCGGKRLSIWNEHGDPDTTEYSMHVEVEFKGNYMSCAWHPSGEMIAAGTMHDPTVTVWKVKNTVSWTEHCKIKIEGATGSVLSLSWNENKLICCTTDGHIYLILVKFDSWSILVQHHDEQNTPLNFVKWQATGSDIFFCGGSTALMVYHVSNTQDGSWKVQSLLKRRFSGAVGGMCFNPSDNTEFFIFKFSGAISTFDFGAFKDWKGDMNIHLQSKDAHGITGLRDFKIPTVPYTAIAWLPENDCGLAVVPNVGYLVLAREDRRIDLYSANKTMKGIFPNEQYFHVWEGIAHRGCVTCIKWRPAGPGVLVSSSTDGTIKLWKLVVDLNITKQRQPCMPTRGDDKVLFTTFD